MRFAVVALLLLNLLLLGWNAGLLPKPGALAAQSPREPERLARQIRPDAVRVVTAPGRDGDAATVSCVEAGPFSGADAETAQQVLAVFGGWRRIDTADGVVLRFDGADAALRAQLQALAAPALGAGFGPCAPR
jgi:hypothetical protein